MRTRFVVVVAVALFGCKPVDPGPGGGAGGPGGAGGGGTSVAASSCTATSTGALFGDALCLCGDLHDIGNLVIDASAPGASGTVGVNGITRMANHMDVSGSFSAYSGLDDAGYTNVHQNLYSSTDVNVAGVLRVAQNLSLGGDLSGIGSIGVGGTLSVGGANNMIGWLDAPTRGTYSASTEPCPCGSSIFDVAGAVAAAKAASSTVILSSVPSGFIGVNVIDLPTGSYYLADAGTIGYSKLHVTGAAQLYVDGMIDEIGADRIVIDPGATLDLYTTGGINTIGYAGLGDRFDPAAFRVYIGSGAPVTLNVGAQWFHGSIYAPLANIVYVGDTNVSGGLFGNELVGVGQLVIGGQIPGTTAGGSCPTPSATAPPVTPTPAIM